MSDDRNNAITRLIKNFSEVFEGGVTYGESQKCPLCRYSYDYAHNCKFCPAGEIFKSNKQFQSCGIICKKIQTNIKSHKNCDAEYEDFLYFRLDKNCKQCVNLHKKWVNIFESLKIKDVKN